MRLIRVFAVLFFSLFTIASFAQNATTSLRGVIKDPTGAMVPGATITLSNSATGQVISTTSKSGGDYQLQQLPPATYTITVTAAGFGSQAKSAELLVNQPATVNFELSVKTSTEVVDVTEAAQTLNTTDASMGQATDNATIQALPSETRNVPDLLSLQPGVLYIPQDQGVSSRSGSVNGGRSDQGDITIDGVDDNDQVNGYAFQGVLRETQDSVEEFRVTTSNGDADAGRSSGAQVSLLTKTGTNKFHGAAYEYYRPTNTVSNQFFLKQGQINSGEDNRPPKLIRHIYGADLGGFIIKDKLFFFGNYEAQRQSESQTVTETTPTALYQQGVLQYTSNGNDVQLSPAQVTALDTANGCAVCNNATEASLEVYNGYPLADYVPYAPGPGPDPNALAYFNLMPAANGTTTGDGLNTGSYTFSSPNPIRLNTSIVKIDWTPTSRQRVFVRGNLQDDVTSGTEQFPGQPPSTKEVSDNKGLTAGDTWTITPNMVNDIRYGYTRQGGGDSGVGSGDYVDFRFMSTATAETRSSVNIVPVNNIVDNFNWTKGKHNIQIGVNWRLIHQNRTSDANSYNNASSNPYWVKGNPPDPASLGGGIGTYDGSFANSYEIAFSNLVGTVPSSTNVYNYEVTSPTSGTLLSDGAPISRHFSANEYEGYVQDFWRILPNLTITGGVRYTLLQTPWETHGQEVTPYVPATTAGGKGTDTDTWYQNREKAALQGQIYEPDLSFAPAGKFYKKPGFYPQNKHDFAPRLAIAFSPDPKTSIRAGAGIYFDHFGEALVNIFDQEGEFGLSTSVTNPAGVLTDATTPRFTDRHTLPFSNGAAASTTSYPYIAPQGNFAITWGLDSKIKTPYSTSLDLSIQHQLPAGFTIEIAYVGRLGTHLMQSLDLAEPVDYVDPQGGGDYYTAGTAISKLSDEHGGDPTAQVQAIPYFEDVFPFMANVDYPGESATQAIYSDEWAPYRYSYGATTSLSDIDYYCNYGCPTGYQSKFWQDQFSSLYALSSIGKSSYHSAQWTLRHPMSHGLQMDVSYTFSKSIDWGSDAERNTEFTGDSFNSNIISTWKPYLSKGVSDFDTTSLLTIDWVYALPIGKGKPFLGTANPIVNALLGGWQSSGIYRMTSGLPFSLFEPGWTTDWQEEGYGVVTDPRIIAHKHFDSSMNPTFFSNPTQINDDVYTGSEIRIPYPGESGQRNNFRGDGYLDLDSGLTKVWKISRYGALKFAWEVYNVTNTNRFDPLSIDTGLTDGRLGIASRLIGGNNAPRRMQFSLRYDF
ncbi:MAG: carboxypeptidase regulatory-like domain-containing protein [Acidobacteriaceae bacterium]